MSADTRLTVGSLLSLFIGTACSFAYVPLLQIQTEDPGASRNNMDYAFSMSTGILVGMLFYFLIYCLYKKNKPDVYPRVSDGLCGGQ